jgi:hypothetical protein
MPAIFCLFNCKNSLPASGATNLATFAFDAISDSSMAVSNKMESGLGLFLPAFCLMPIDDQ